MTDVEYGKQRYRTDNGKICIELKLKSTKQLFDQRDPAPFIERDLDDDAVEYIVSSAEEIPENKDLKVVIYISEESASEIREDEIKSAIQNFFSYKAQLIQREFNEVTFRGRIFFAFGLFFLVVCLMGAEFAKMIENAQLRTVLSEGLMITGWVAMWRPLETFLYDRWPIRRKLLLYNKLASSDIVLFFT